MAVNDRRSDIHHVFESWPTAIVFNTIFCKNRKDSCGIKLSGTSFTSNESYIKPCAAAELHGRVLLADDRRDSALAVDVQ